MKKGIKRAVSLIMTLLFVVSGMPQTAVVAEDEVIITKFSFDQLDYADKSLNDTYGGSASSGYGATSGVLKDSATLFASVNGVDTKKIEWSNFEGGDGNDYTDSDGNSIGSAPVMAAGSKHQWADVTDAPPFFEVIVSTAGYSDVTFSAEIGGSKKGAKSFALSYSLDGERFTPIGNSGYAINKNKKLEKAYTDFALPDSADNAQELHLMIYATSDETIGGDVLSSNPDGGETAINNISFKGVPISGDVPRQPVFETLTSRIEEGVLTVTNKNISAKTASAAGMTCLYNEDVLVKVFMSEIDSLSENKKHTIDYSVSDIEFDSVKVFSWNSFEEQLPLSGNKSYERDDIEYIPGEDDSSQYSNEPAYQDIPIVTLTGDITGISRDVYKDVVLTYESSTEEFTSYASIKWQGRSSVTQGYPKYNYSLKMYSDEERTIKDKHQFKTWLPAHNYCLKANWIDSTHARNIVNARLAASIQENPLPTGATGVVDGFPIHVYLNGEDMGIYTWNIPKKDWTFNMSDDNPNHIAFGAENQTGSNLFAAYSSSDRDWELICPDDTGTERPKLNRLIGFVKDSTVEEFRANFDQYLDLDSTINYYVFAHIIGHTDGYAKNMILATFDGNIWYPTLYDMDSTWGLYWTGSKILGADILCNPDSTEATMYNTSKLWSKLEAAFGDEIYERYIELRADKLSDEKIIAEFEYFINGIPQELYDLDEAVWEGKSSKHKYIPSRDFRLEQIKTFLKEHIPYVDAWMEGLRSDTE